jgi:putative transposase
LVPLLSTAIPIPRISRSQVAGHACHILSRGNGGAIVFEKERNYTAFLGLLAMAKRKFPLQVFGFRLMPNHFHLVLQPATGNALNPFMQWWMTSHVRRYHRHYRSSGQIWQGRFKIFPIQQYDHLRTVLRYELRNPVRAQLVASSRQ